MIIETLLAITVAITSYVAIGDSITTGYKATESFIDLLEDDLGEIDNVAIGGTWAFGQYYQLENYTGPATNVIWLSGYNDMRSPYSTSEYYHYWLTKTLTLAQDRGYKIYIGECLYMTENGYKTYPGIGDGGSYEKVNEINTIIKDEALNYQDVMVVKINDFYDIDNVDNDLVHPNNEGHFQIYEAFLESIIKKTYIPIIFNN